MSESVAKGNNNQRQDSGRRSHGANYLCMCVCVCVCVCGGGGGQTASVCEEEEDCSFAFKVA